MQNLGEGRMDARPVAAIRALCSVGADPNFYYNLRGRGRNPADQASGQPAPVMI
jgi:hypothetical protein